MVIFFNMIVKRYIKTVVVLLFCFSLHLLIVPTVNATSPTLSFYPSSGIIKDPDEGFAVDILIDSGGEELSKVTAAFNFDPEQLQIVEANKNNTLFEQWPEDESSLDNQNGVVMLTGFTQSGSDELYQTVGNPDVFARVEFEVLEDDLDEEILLSWDFGESDPLFETVLIVDGSPPQNILDTASLGSRPQDAVFRLGELTQTAIDSRYLPFILGGLMILIAGVVISSKPETTRKKFGTVVVYDE
jgi:hypothetical protein